jgi:predicted GNAT superfamily acetyltransferase
MTLTPAELGFTPVRDGWHKPLGGASFLFRELHTYAEMEPLLDLQRAVWRMDDLDVVPLHELVTVPETGGMVLGAWREGEPTLAGFLFGWGGFVDGRPRLASDMMGVRPGGRHAGLGFALKSLQAALALARGYRSVVWTVDPLRAANARLNFAKLGAFCHVYHRSLYGAGFAPDFYCDMPSDDLAVRWPIASERVRGRLLSPAPALTLAGCAGLPRLRPGDTPDGERLMVEFPADIDHLLAHDVAAARDWRERVRATLETAFAHGYAITDAVFARGAGEEQAFFVLDRDGWQAWADVGATH